MGENAKVTAPVLNISTGVSQEYEHYACWIEKSENMMSPYHICLRVFPGQDDVHSTTEESLLINLRGESMFLLPAEKPSAKAYCTTNIHS